jgi:AraC-like DNA-binding protein
MSIFVTGLFIFIGIAMLIFTVLLLTAKKKTSVTFWLGTWVLCFGYIWAYYGFFRLTGIVDAPWLLGSDLFAESIAGPALYLYARSLIGVKESPRKFRTLLPFIPALLYFAYLLAFRPSERLPIPAAPGSNPTYFWDPVLDTLNTLADCYFYLNVSLATATIIRAYKQGNAQFRKAFVGVLLYFIIGTLTFIGFMIGHLFHQDIVLGLSVLFNGFNTTYLFFFSNRNPEYTQRQVKLTIAGAESEAIGTGVAGGAANKSSTTSTSLPRGVDVQRLLAQLAKLIEEEGGYRDPALSLQSLSSRLGIPNHQLSKLLNENMGMNFRGYINRYRLEEAKRLLAEKSGMSILDIAYAVGFNSKSAFNSSFAKELGLSPSDYRKQSSGKTR